MNTSRTECGTRPALRAMLYSHGSSSWAPAIHTKILCSCLCSPFQSSRYMAQSSTVCFSFLPRLEGSTKRLVRPVQSTIGLFKSHVRMRSGNLLRNSLQAPCTLTQSVRIEAKPKLDMVLLSLGTIVCVLSSPEVLSCKHGDKFSQRLDRRCYSDRHCTTKVKRLWNFSIHARHNGTKGT